VILTHKEICLLTERTRPKAQARALEFLGIPCRVRRDGSLVVLRASVNTLLGIATETVIQKRNLPTPNWNGI
jgi:hypothetical protein